MHEKRRYNPYQQIKDATDLISLIEEIGNVKLIPAGPNMWQCNCPHPDHDDDDPSFRVYHNRNGSWTWHCFGCGGGTYDPKNGNYGNDCFAFLQWMSDYKGSKKVLTNHEVLEILADRAHIVLKDTSKFHEDYQFMEMQSKAYEKNLTKEAIAYLNKRGLDLEDIRAAHLGYFPFKECSKEDGKWIPRIVSRITFPIIDPYGRTVGFSNRVLADGVKPKYIIVSRINETHREQQKQYGKNAENSFQKRHYLYGIDQIRRDEDSIFLVEGQMDVLLGRKYSRRNFAGVFGHTVSDEQIEVLKDMDMHTVILAFDGDKAGQEGVRSSWNKLASAGFNVKVLHGIEESMDIADLALKFKDKLDDYLDAHILPLWRYELNDAVSIYEDGLSDLQHKILPYIKKSKDIHKSKEDDILFRSFVQERFKILI